MPLGDPIREQSFQKTVKMRAGGEEGGGHHGSVSMPSGTSGCMHWFGVSGINDLHCVPQSPGQREFQQVKKGPLSLCSPVPHCPMALEREGGMCDYI